MKAFVIHLDRATERRAHAEALVSQLPCEAKIWSACDGAAIPPVERDAFVADRPLFEPEYPFPLSSGEIGCFESHRSLWRHMIERDLSHAFVMEDDAVIGSDFAGAFAQAEARIQKIGYIQFQTRAVPEMGQGLIQPEVVPLRTSAQMVSLAAAKALFAASEQIDRPVDVFIQMHWETGVRPYCVVPSGVSDLEMASTVQSKRTFGQKLRAEWLRGRYRAKIKSLSRQHS